MQHLIIDSDDDFSIATSELSAWDSDVHSIRTLASCANSWAEAADFQAPAMCTLRIALLVTAVRAGGHNRPGPLLCTNASTRTAHLRAWSSCGACLPACKLRSA